MKRWEPTDEDAERAQKVDVNLRAQPALLSTIRAAIIAGAGPTIERLERTIELLERQCEDLTVIGDEAVARAEKAEAEVERRGGTRLGRGLVGTIERLQAEVERLRVAIDKAQGRIDNAIDIWNGGNHEHAITSMRAALRTLRAALAEKDGA